MTDIICNWLNNDVKLSVRVDATNFAREFATGYLIGEVLHKYQLQDDFDKFSQNRTSESKLNNLTRVEPSLHTLEVPYDTNIAHDIMTEKQGVATRLMYQVFVAINKKEKNNLTGAAMETMRPAAPVKLEAVESLMYRERLKHLTPRQTDLDLEELVARFHQKQIQMESLAFKERFEEEQKFQQMLADKRQELIDKYRDNQARKSEMLAKINAEYEQGRECERQIMMSTGRLPNRRRAATVHIPKPPSSKTAKAIAQRRALRRQAEAEAMKRDTQVFDERMKRTLAPSKSIGDEDTENVLGPPSDPFDLIKPASNDEYIGHIRKRLNEDAAAREEREKRRRKVLVDQLKAHEAQEEARREEMLVNRLMRQSQQERRIAVQLLHARHEKEVIRRNRLAQEKEYESRRLIEFQEALNREAEHARLAKLEYIDQTKKDQELHDKIMKEKAEERYNKHYNMNSEILSDIVDFSTKVAEYRELTNKLLPAKLMRDWKELFVSGLPLYDAEGDAPKTPEQLLEEERQKLLDEGDFTEYRTMTGEWKPPESSEIQGPPKNNPIVGHIVQRLMDRVYPPEAPPAAPEFPPFPIKACILGKAFAGKTSVCKQLSESHRIEILNVDSLVEEALEAHKNGEIVEIEPEVEETKAPESNEKPPESEEKPENSDSNRQTEDSNPPPAEEGAEKSDPEKPVPAEEASTEPRASSRVKSIPSKQKESVSGVEQATGSLSKSHKGAGNRKLKPEASPRALLGAKALKFLKKGKPVDDALQVEILVEAIRRIPEGTGWILDGFPCTQAQAKLMEKALSGFDTNTNKTQKSKSKRSQLAPDPKPVPVPPKPSSGINVVILFDITNELCLKRSAGRSYASQADKQFHQEFNPPPEGSATGIGKTEKVIPVVDPHHDQEQIQHRLTAFEDAWPKMEKWFSKFGALKTVDASQDADDVFSKAEAILVETIKKLTAPPEEDVLVVEEPQPKEEEKPKEPEKPPEPPAEPSGEETDRSRPSSKKPGSRGGSGKRSGSRGSADKKKKSESPSKDSGGKKSAKSSRASSPKSPKGGKKSGKKGKTPEPEPEPEPEAPPGTPPPQPGSAEWEYVDEPLEDQLCETLAPLWELIESSYINNSKQVFRNIRVERDMIIQYLYQIKKTFLEYLRRPDAKQEFVSQWQKDFNSISDDLREDEEMKSELHQSVDDLRERLWTICDERKAQAETEREGIMGDGWLDDHVGLLTNHYISQMQVEVDRFQETIRLLKDYYRGMEGKIPDEMSSEYIRLPLVELPVMERNESPAKSDTSEGAKGKTSPASPSPQDGSGSKSGTPSGKRGKKSEAGADVSEPEDEAAAAKPQPKIPLVPRRPASPDASGGAAAAKGKGDKGKGDKGKGKDPSEDGPCAPTDLDEKLLFDAHLAAVSAIEKAISAEQAAREAEEEAEREREREKELEKQKAAADSKKKGGKGGGKDKGGKKSRSPSPKKSKGKDSPSQPTPPPSSLAESEEDRQKKSVKERARQEFTAAIEEEAAAAKVRLELVMKIGSLVQQELKSKSEAAYTDMNDWLGARFLQEMESIDQLSEVARNAVEAGTKIKEEFIIQQQNFFVNKDVKTLKTPSPPPRSPPAEPVTVDAFTVDQIMTIFNQFMLTAPDGMLSLRAFQDTFQDLTSLTHGTGDIPDIWANIPQEKLESLSAQISPDGEYIDWRAFLLQASHPWPVPSQAELLETLARFKEMDQKETGYVTREQFDRVALWFKEGCLPPVTPDDPCEPLPYDRLANLKRAFFDIFADHTMDPPQLDYVNMLMYFSYVPDAQEGFLRALSVAAGTHMPRLSQKKVVSRPPSQASAAASIDLEEDKSNLADVALSLNIEDIPETAEKANVPLEALYNVLHQGQAMRGDSHRLSGTSNPDDMYSRERLAGIYQELGADNTCNLLPFATLMEHPVMQDITSSINTYKALDLKALLSSSGGDNLEVQSMKTSD